MKSVIIIFLFITIDLFAQEYPHIKPVSVTKAPSTKNFILYNNQFTDSDSDGISNEFDKCPQTPLNSNVNKFGCSEKKYLAQNSDLDNDGITNSRDYCPYTPKGFLVNKTGCEVKKNLYLEFKEGSSDIDSKDLPKILNFAKFLK
jgi:hypothetical protein